MEDHFDIRALPSNFVSKSHHSEVIEKLNEKREKAHKDAIDEICLKTKEINVEIEEEILNKSNKIKCRLKQIRDDTDYSLYLVQHTKEHEFDSMEKTYFQNISKKILRDNETRKVTVDELYYSIVEIEKKRGEKLKLILREAYTKLLDISYQLPFELEEYFEKEILKINQLTLNNYQNYVELQAELKLQIENDMKTWTQRLYEIKEKFQKHLKDRAIQQSEESEEQSPYDYIDTTFARMNRRLSEYDAVKMVLEFKLSQIYINVDLKNIHLWLQDIQMTMACLDKSAKYIANIYKAAIVVIFHRFFKELEDIKTSMLDIDMLSREEIKPYECEIYTPTVEELDLKNEAEFQQIKDVWGKLIKYIEDSLNETYTFVKNATYLWDHHFVRIGEARQLVLEDVNNTIEKNIFAEETFETTLNILLDRLRQAPTEEKLNKYLNDIKDGLERVNGLYQIHNNEEQKVLDRYKELVDIEIDVLMAELKRFLCLNPPDEERDPKKQRKRASQESHIFIDPTEALIPNQMLFCRYEVEAVSNWMFGLWEAISHYLTCGRTEVMAIAEEWIEQQCDKIRTRLDVKLDMFSSRYKRIECSIYEKRLEELYRHAERFQSHQLAVEMEIKALTENKYLYEEKYNEIINKFAGEKEKTIKKILIATRSSQIRRFKADINVTATEAMDSMTSTLNDSNDACDKLSEKIKLSNMRYMRAIKLFSEDGNYDVEEAKVLLKNLNKVNANATKKFDVIKKQNKTMRDYYVHKLEATISETLSSMHEIIEELEHNEKTVKRITLLQNEIRDLVISAKTPAIKLKKQLKILTEISTAKLGQTDYLQIFSKKSQEIEEQVNRDAPFLIHPEPVIMYSSVKTKRPATSTVSNDIKHDFIHELFNTKPNETDEHFVSKLNNLLYKSFHKIQEAAKEFYSKHRILLDLPKIQPSYNLFMAEVLRKYRNFLVQSEICWFETASDFTNFLDNFSSFKKQYLLVFENKFCNTSDEYYANIYNEIMKKLQKEREELECTFKKMHSKLKTLHGHPNNNHLLKQLEQEFQRLIKDTEAKLNAILTPYKDTLLQEFEKIKDTYDIAKAELHHLSQNNEELINIQTTFMNQILTKSDLMTHLIEVDERTSLGSDNEKSGDTPLSISGQIMTYMKNKNAKSSSQVETDNATDSTVSNQMYEKVSLRNFLTELQENFESYDQNITDFVEKKLLTLHAEFQLAWANDVKNILDLYRVKYDTKNLLSK